MEPQELRIGNYIIYECTDHIVSGVLNDKIYSWWVKDGKPLIEYESKDVGGDQVENPYIDHISRYEPLPLTEEWLLKFGFKVKDRKSNLDTDIFYIPTFEIDYCLFYADFRLDYGLYVEYTDSPFPEDDEKLYPITFGIKYVHQLQNLLYSLTREELTIK
jgi:hypothetical protein